MEKIGEDLMLHFMYISESLPLDSFKQQSKLCDHKYI